MVLDQPFLCPSLQPKDWGTEHCESGHSKWLRPSAPRGGLESTPQELGPGTSGSKSLTGWTCDNGEGAAGLGRMPPGHPVRRRRQPRRLLCM